MKLIYLHLYKDTFLIFMQAYEQLQLILDYSKNFRKGKEIYFPNINAFTISKINILFDRKCRK